MTSTAPTIPAAGTRLPLLNRDGEVVGHTLLDPADVEWFSEWRWRLHADGYACRGRKVNGRSTVVMLHRQVLGLPSESEFFPDHINRDRLDNRRVNLRVVTRSVNNINRGRFASATSPFRGVYRTETRAGTVRWRAAVRRNGTIRNLGNFGTPETADAAVRAFVSQVTA